MCGTQSNGSSTLSGIVIVVAEDTTTMGVDVWGLSQDCYVAAFSVDQGQEVAASQFPTSSLIHLLLVIGGCTYEIDEQELMRDPNLNNLFVINEQFKHINNS